MTKRGLQLWCPRCPSVPRCSGPEVRQDGFCVEQLKLGHSLFPHVGVKGDWDNGQLPPSVDHQVGTLQAGHSQLTLDLCVVTMRRLQSVGRRLETWGREGGEGKGWRPVPQGVRPVPLGGRERVAGWYLQGEDQYLEKAVFF